MFESGQETLSNVREGWESLSDIQEWSVGPPGCLGMVGRPSLMSGSGREALPDVREFLGGPPE